MRFKSTWVLIAVFAALAAYLYFVENPRYQAQQESEEKSGLLFPDLDTEQVTELAIEGERGSVRVKKGEEDKWYVVEPWDDRADDGRVRGLLSDLKGLRAEKEVAGADADLGAFGLAEPEVVVQAAGIEARLAIGAENPVGDSRYVRSGEGPVQVAKSSSVTGFFGEPGDLRNKDVLEGYPWSRLASVEIRRAAGEAIRLVKPGETWMLETPFRAEADPDSADRLAEKFRWARVNRFLDGDREKAEEELSKGIAVVLEAEGEDSPTTVRMAEVEDEVWADRTGRDALFAVTKDLWEAFQVSAEDLRRKKPVLAKAWKARRVELEQDGKTLSYSKEGDSWQRGGNPVEGRETTALQDFLRALEETKADRVIDQPGPEADYGLDDPEFKVVVDDGEGEHTLTLARKGDKVFARSVGESPVYEMPAEYVDKADAVAKSVEPAPEESDQPEGSSKEE